MISKSCVIWELNSAYRISIPRDINKESRTTSYSSVYSHRGRIHPFLPLYTLAIGPDRSRRLGYDKGGVTLVTTTAQPSAGLMSYLSFV